VPSRGADVGREAEEQFERVWAQPTEWRAISAVNNSVVASRFIITGFVFFLVGGVMALLLRTQLIAPDNDFLSPELYNQLFTMHGTVMMFVFAVPVMEAFGAYLVPGMMGTRDLSFPRLTSYGYWCYLCGGLLLLSSFLFGTAPDGGWFMYVPLTSREYSIGMNQDFWLLGVTFVEIASITGALELIVTVLKSRAPGMSLSRLPIFAWYMLAVSFMIIFGFPPLVLASIMLEAQRVFGLPFFDVSQGGDPLLWQHLFWIFGHPEVYIIFLPAAGLVSAMLPALARTTLVAYRWLVLAVIGTAFLSFGLWVHHMYATGIPMLALSFFAGASMAVAIPSGIQVFAWIGTLWNGRPQLRTPLLFIIGFIVIFVLGGLTGVMVAMVPFDWQVHDTYFVVAHFHYVLIGGMVFPLFAALFFYTPRLSGRMLSERLGQVSFWLLFIGFNVAFLPMHLTGLLGMPRRVFSYPAEAGWSTLNLISTLGAYMVAAGVLVFIVNVFWHLRWGRPAGINPWGAPGLEWADITPEPDFSIRSIPEVTSMDPLWDQEGLLARIRNGDEYLATAPEGKREVFSTSILDGTPQHVERLPGPTFLPMFAAIATALVFICVLLSVYEASAAGAAEPLPEKDSKDIGKGLRLPIDIGDRTSAGWAGAIIFLLVDAAIFASLVYSYFYLWTVSPVWPPVGYRPVIDAPVLIGVVLLLASLPTAIVAHHGASSGQPRVALIGLALTVVLLGAMLAVGWLAYLAFPFAIDSHAYAAVVASLAICLALHALLVIGAGGFAIARTLVVGVTRERSLAVRVAALLAFYTVLQGVIVYAVIYLSPDATG
jgi:cytochrome c oxidase subunit I+III